VIGNTGCSKATGRALLLASVGVLAGLPVAARAQPADVGEVVVTGSRIVRDGYTAPTPVTVAAVEDLQDATPSSIADGLNKLPQFANSVSPRGNPNLNPNTGEHGNLLNLRGVGPTRSLILFDGLRVPPTTFKGGVDVNTLPQLLVDRVDVVTAGASAAYGSDAVSGVVNYVLNENFKGVKGLAQYGLSDRHDLQNYRLGVAAGTPVLDGRGHLLFSAERTDADEIVRSDRIYGDNRSSAVGSVVGSTAAPGTAANPLVFMTGLSSIQQTFGGKITSSTVPSLVNSVFQPDGTIRPFVNGPATGTATVKVGGDGFYTPGYGTLSPKLTTNQFFGRISFDLNDNLKVYAQANYGSYRTTYRSQALFILGARVFSGNAFLNPAVQARLGPNDSFVVQEILPQYGPMVTRENGDSGMYALGLSGKVMDAWKWRLDYVRGESRSTAGQQNFQYPRLAAAIDAVRDPSGAIVCRVTLTNPGLYPGCVPYNPFGQGAASPAALAYTTDISRFHTVNTTDDLSFSAQGDLFALPAGRVSLAFGAEHRVQTLKLTSNSDPAHPPDLTGLRAPINTSWFNSVNFGVADGRVKVNEAFGEVAVPLLKDAPFAQSLDLNAAGRITHYSTSGTAKTWKVGATWAPFDQMSFRITRSRDLRAPGLYDLFAGQTFLAASFTDPHTGQAPFLRVQNGGNPDLKPETGDTFTMGVVLRPSFVPNFNASLDYYDLKITGAIATQTAIDILNECEASGGTSPSCELITRPLPFSDRSAANAPTAIRVVNQNLSFIRTKGVDLDLSYRAEVGPGQLSLRGYANWVFKFDQQSNSVAPVIDYAGYVANGTVNYSLPKFRGVLSARYKWAATELFLQETMIGKMKLGPTQVYAVPPIKRYFYTDATITQQLPRAGMEAFLTINNLFDKKPPFVPGSGTSAGTYYPTLPQLYDVVGRAYTAGVRFQF